MGKILFNMSLKAEETGFRRVERHFQEGHPPTSKLGKACRDFVLLHLIKLLTGSAFWPPVHVSSLIG